MQERNIIVIGCGNNAIDKRESMRSQVMLIQNDRRRPKRTQFALGDPHAVAAREGTTGEDDIEEEIPHEKSM